MTDSDNVAVEPIENDVSTSSPAEPEVIDELANEVEAESEVEETEASTPDSVAKKPRHRRTDAAIIDSEARIMAEVDKRLASMQLKPETVDNQQNYQQGQSVDSELERQLAQFRGDIQAINESDNDYDKQVAKTMTDTLQNNNNLSDLSVQCLSQLIKDRITPDELHEINNRFGNEIKPSTPEAEYRMMKRFRRQVKIPEVPKKVKKVAPKPTGSVDGGAVSARQRDANFFYDQFRGGK